MKRSNLSDAGPALAAGPSRSEHDNRDGLPTNDRPTMATLCALGSLALAATLTAADPISRPEVTTALKKAATYFHGRVASHGGYAYYYSLDLAQRWGEGVGTADQIWVEPPGTPAVGIAYLKAFDATGDRFYLEAARDAGLALVYGQLQSGGWTQVIDFDPKGSHVALYRNGRGSGRNHTSLDDNQTQAALQFLARLDRALGFKDAAIHEAARFALDALLKAQFPVGAFPQGFTGPVAAHPPKAASYPDPWPRTWPNDKYWDYYTLNDNVAGNVADALLTAIETYGDASLRAAIARLGDFLVLAQMPEPQPAWCQQYSYEMQPIWARKFEPPAICSLESEDAIRALMKVYRLTGDKKYLAPIPRALAYLRRSRLPDGRMARYYELQTNRPLYLLRPPGVSGSSKDKRGYELTYDDTNLPPHYGWKQDTAVEELEKELARLETSGPGGAVVTPRFTDNGKLISVLPGGELRSLIGSRAELEARVRAIVRDLDEQGRWVTTYGGDRGGHDLIGQPKFAAGFRFLGTHVFNRNVEILSDYLAATR